MDMVGRVSPCAGPAAAYPEPFGSVEPGAIERGAGVWFCLLRPRCSRSFLLMFSEYSCWVRSIGVEVEPPLDSTPLMLLGHAAVMEEQKPHLGVRASLDPVR